MPAFTLRRTLLFIVFAGALLFAVAGVQANVRVDGFDPPYYARIAGDEIYHTDQWAVIVFYRQPGCVPSGFNLLTFFDFSLIDCLATVDGFRIFSDPGLPPPIQISLHGLGEVPVWFVPWPDLQLAIADGELSVPELQSMPTLVTGTADFFKEMLHPLGGAQVPMIEFDAHGSLEDGRSFQVHVALVEGVATNVAITMR